MKNKIYCFFLLLISCSIQGYGQITIAGNFPPLKNQTIRLMGFNGMGTYVIDSTQVMETGSFTLRYSLKDLGMGYIFAADNKPYFTVLEKQAVELKGESLSVPESITIIKGAENKAFVAYATAHTKREQTLSAWKYLQKIYQGDALFLNQKTVQQSIASEIKRIGKQDLDFLSNLPSTSYAHWYLPIRKLISSVSTVAQYRTQEIPATITAFRKIDYADPRLYKSGLLKDALESQYWLLENRGLPLDTIYKDMNVSTDFILKSIAKNEQLYNEITKYLFDYFEKHSLFQASEYLAIKTLSQNSCTINNNLANQLESYRAMKIGNTATNILFTGDVVKNGLAIKTPNRLSDINSNYKVVIFGASWCIACSEEMAQLFPLYSKWKAKGLEVVFISLDMDKIAFQNYTNVMPFISFCDYQKWNTQSAKDYYISSSPTIYMLDKNNKIILRPRFIKAIDTWIDYNLETLDANTNN
jgi:thiol-disulfide isomerase/thioredoxin